MATTFERVQRKHVIAGSLGLIARQWGYDEATDELVVMLIDGTTEKRFGAIGNQIADIDVLNDVTIAGGLNSSTDADITTVGNVPVIIKKTIPFGDYSFAGTVNDIELFEAPAGLKIKGVTIKHSTPFTGGAVATCVIAVGIASNFVKYSANFNVFQATGNTVFQDTNTIGIENMGAVTSIRTRITTTGDDINTLTAGSVDIWVECVRIA